MTKYYGSNTTLSIVKETEEGVIPNNPVWKEIRYTDESLVDGWQSTQSSLVTDSGAVSDTIRTGQQPSGGFNTELTYNEATEILFESLLRAGFVGSQCKAGIGSVSFSIEKKITDGTTPRYFRTKGAKVNSLSLTADSSNGIITGSVDIQARATENSGAILSGATYESAPLTDVFAFKDFTFEVYIGGEKVTCSSFDINIATGLRIQSGRTVGDSTPDTNAKGVAYGQRVVTGNMSAYYGLGAQKIYDKLTSDGHTYLEYHFSNGTNFYKFVMPKVKITDAPVQSGGNDSDVQVAIAWQALVSAVPAIYNSATVYEVGDIVSASDDNVYICKTADATGAGDNPATSTAKWDSYGKVSDFGTDVSIYKG